MVNTDFSSIGQAIIEKLIAGGVIVGLVLILGVCLVVFFFVLRYYRQFNVKVRMKTKRSIGADGQPIYKIYYSKGGILTNKKDKRSYFRVLSDKVDLPTPPFEALQITADGKNEIEIVKDGEGVYSYIVPGKIDRGYVMTDRGAVKTGVQQSRGLESDVEYWNTLRKKDNRRMFMTDTFKLQLLFAGVLFLMVIAVIFFTYIWLDKAPALISASQSVAEEIKLAAQALGSCQAQVTPK